MGTYFECYATLRNVAWALNAPPESDLRYREGTSAYQLLWHGFNRAYAPLNSWVYVRIPGAG